MQSLQDLVEKLQQNKMIVLHSTYKKQRSQKLVKDLEAQAESVVTLRFSETGEAAKYLSHVDCPVTIVVEQVKDARC